MWRWDDSRMSSIEPLIPHPDRFVEDVRDDGELEARSPDVLGGPAESRLDDGVESLAANEEPDEPAHDFSRALPIRKPAVGEQLTPEQLAAELDAE
jgi:hypothetical protein